MIKPTSLLFLLLLLCIIYTSATITITNLQIQSIDGSTPIPNTTTNRYIIPVLSTITITWQYTNTDNNDNILYQPILTYTNQPSILFDQYFFNIDITSQLYTFTLPSGYSSNDTGILTLSLYPLTTTTTTPITSDDDIQLITPITTTTLVNKFDVISLCEYNINYCGIPQDGTICDEFTSKCTSCANNYTGTNCELSPCQSLQCIETNTDFITTPCNNDEPKCLCKDGWSGEYCEIATICQNDIICDHNGYVNYQESSDAFTCDTQCTCNGFWINPTTTTETKPNGCSLCNLSCQYGGKLMNETECTQCQCKLGFNGADCSQHYSAGRLTFTGLENYITLLPLIINTTDPIQPTNDEIYNDNKRKEFLSTLYDVVYYITQLESTEVILDTTYNSTITTKVKDNNGKKIDETILYYNIVFRFPYISSSLPDGTIAIPRLLTIQQGWKNIQNDLFIYTTIEDSKNKGEYITTTEINPNSLIRLFLHTITTEQQQQQEEPTQQESQQKSIPSLTTLLSKLSTSSSTSQLLPQQENNNDNTSTMIIPSQPPDLWDPACSILLPTNNNNDDNLDNNNTNPNICTKGPWPYSGTEPIDRSDQSAIRYWVIGLGCGAAVFGILLILVFETCGGVETFITPARAEYYAKLRSKQRIIRDKKLKDRDAILLQKKNEDQLLLQQRRGNDDNNTDTTTPTTTTTTATATIN